MTELREKLIQILSVPIYAHELADPTEVVADYLLDNDVVPVVRCKDCKYCDPEWNHCDHPMSTSIPIPRKPDDFCSYGERRADG